MASDVNKISLKTVAMNVATVVATGKSILVLFQYAAEVMDASEKAYSGVSGAGKFKKEAVLAAVTTLAGLILKVDIKETLIQIASFIDSCKTLYNQFNAISTGSA